MVSYGGKTIPRWRTAAILKINISPYLSEKSSDFHEILYTAADFELNERHAIKNEKVALDRLRVRQNVFLVDTNFHALSPRGTSITRASNENVVGKTAKSADFRQINRYISDINIRRLQRNMAYVLMHMLAVFERCRMQQQIRL